MDEVGQHEGLELDCCCSYTGPQPESHWPDGYKSISPESSPSVTGVGKRPFPPVLAQI